MTFLVREQRDRNDHLNMLALRTKAATVESARAASGQAARRQRRTEGGDFGDQRPSRR